MSSRSGRTAAARKAAARRALPLMLFSTACAAALERSSHRQDDDVVAHAHLPFSLLKPKKVEFERFIATTALSHVMDMQNALPSDRLPHLPMSTPYLMTLSPAR